MGSLLFSLLQVSSMLFVFSWIFFWDKHSKMTSFCINTLSQTITCPNFRRMHILKLVYSNMHTHVYRFLEIWTAFTSFLLLKSMHIFKEIKLCLIFVLWLLFLDRTLWRDQNELKCSRSILLNNCLSLSEYLWVTVEDECEYFLGSNVSATFSFLLKFGISSRQVAHRSIRLSIWFNWNFQYLIAF